MATDIAQMNISSGLASGQMEGTDVTKSATASEVNIESNCNTDNKGEFQTSKKLTDTRFLPSRVLTVKQVRPDVNGKVLQKLFETYGPIKENKIIKEMLIVVYFDLRHATLALQDLNGRNLNDFILNINYVNVHENDCDFVKFSQVDEDGRILVNLDYQVLNLNNNNHSESNEFHDLNKLFSTFGHIRAIQDLPNGAKQKVIEFYDLRSAEAAVKALGDKGSKYAQKENNNMPIALTISELQQKYKLPILIPQRLFQPNITKELPLNKELKRRSFEDISKTNELWPQRQLTSSSSTSKSFNQYPSASKSCPSLTLTHLDTANTCDEDLSLNMDNDASNFINKRSLSSSGSGSGSGIGLGSEVSVSIFEKQNNVINLTSANQVAKDGFGKINNLNKDNTVFPTSHQYYFDHQQNNVSNDQLSQQKTLYNGKNTNNVDIIPEIDSLNLTNGDLPKNENQYHIQNEMGIGISIKDDLPKALGLYDDETNSNSDFPIQDPLSNEEISSASTSSNTATTSKFQSRNHHDISKNNFMDWSNLYPQDQDHLGLPKYGFLDTHFNDLKSTHFNSMYENNLIHQQGYFNNLPIDNNCAMLHHLHNQINFGYPVPQQQQVPHPAIPLPHHHHHQYQSNSSSDPMTMTSSAAMTGSPPLIPNPPIQNNYNYHIFNAHQHNQHLNQLLLNQRYLMPYQSHEILLSQYLQSLNQAALLQQAVGMEVLKRLADSNGALLHGLGILDGTDEDGEDEDSLRSKILRTIWESGERQGYRRKGKFGRRNAGGGSGNGGGNGGSSGGGGDKNSAMSSEKKLQQEKMFAMDLERIKSGQDKRTTLMIKNIPNKYTQRMLLSRIEEEYKGTFDFFYLPIDFKNKCNVGYGFINMNKPENIIRFVENMHEQRWDKFNSEKVCCVTYARIQGRTALINHFQNSSLMLEDSKHQPLLFGPDGEPELFPTEPIA